MRTRNDPALYRALSAPFPNPDACNEALDAFFEEVGALRTKYKIRELLVVAGGSVIYPDPDGEGEWRAPAQWGDPMHATALAGFALGQAEAAVREHINRTVEHAKRGGRKG